jgi:hypothetical protein
VSDPQKVRRVDEFSTERCRLMSNYRLFPVVNVQLYTTLSKVSIKQWPKISMPQPLGFP